MDFGARVKSIMNQKNIKQNQLARDIGMSSSGISTALQPNSNPRLDTVIAIAENLGCSVSELLGENSVNDLTYQEKEMIRDFRSLSQPGKEYILQTMAMAVITYAEKSPSLPGMEEAE